MKKRVLILSTVLISTVLMMCLCACQSSQSEDDKESIAKQLSYNLLIPRVLGDVLTQEEVMKELIWNGEVIPAEWIREQVTFTLPPEQRLTLNPKLIVKTQGLCGAIEVSLEIKDDHLTRLKKDEDRKWKRTSNLNKVSIYSIAKSEQIKSARIWFDNRKGPEYVLTVGERRMVLGADHASHYVVLVNPTCPQELALSLNKEVTGEREVIGTMQVGRDYLIEPTGERCYEAGTVYYGYNSFGRPNKYFKGPSVVHQVARIDAFLKSAPSFIKSVQVNSSQRYFKPSTPEKCHGGINLTRGASAPPGSAVVWIDHRKGKRSVSLKIGEKSLDIAPKSKRFWYIQPHKKNPIEIILKGKKVGVLPPSSAYAEGQPYPDVLIDTTGRRCYKATFPKKVGKITYKLSDYLYSKQRKGKSDYTNYIVFLNKKYVHLTAPLSSFHWLRVFTGVRSNLVDRSC